MTLDRARVAMYAAGAVAGVALVCSVFVLTREGVRLADAVASAIPPSIAFALVALASRHACRAVPIRTAGFTRIVATHVGGAVAAAGVWLLVWQQWLALLGRAVADLPMLFAIGVFLYGATVAVQYLVLEVQAAKEAEEEALRYQLLAREAELKAFKAQIDPHFLFNSLNAVAALCGSRPNDARAMTQMLADFFRQTLRHGGLDRVTLAEELELVRRYLAIEQVRFGSRLAVRIDVDERAAVATVPPLVLQPLVENAVRHGIASMTDGGTIDLSATMVDGRLRISIENPADPDRPRKRGEGIGIQNARGRINAMSGGRALFRAAEEAGRFRVEIEVPS